MRPCTVYLSLFIARKEKKHIKRDGEIGHTGKKMGRPV